MRDAVLLPKANLCSIMVALYFTLPSNRTSMDYVQSFLKSIGKVVGVLSELIRYSNNFQSLAGSRPNNNNFVHFLFQHTCTMLSSLVGFLLVWKAHLGPFRILDIQLCQWFVWNLWRTPVALVRDQRLAIFTRTDIGPGCSLLGNVRLQQR